jgi:uncharacterized membrane protein YsdA (DUF1294 family)
MVQYIVFINLIGFFIMAADKYKAKHRKWRIAESTIWFISIIGGAIGTTAGMRLFRHKTKHRSFRYGLPLIAVIEAMTCIIFYYL